MKQSAFDLGEELSLRELVFKPHIGLWNKYPSTGKIDLSAKNWRYIKYLNATNNGLSASVNLIPNTTGGLYLFTIKCDIIPGITEFPVYIGRAQYSSGQNLRKRCREYFNKYAQNNERPKITRMFNYWKENLCLYFIPLPTNHDIINYEKDLINSLLLPFNDEIPDQETRQGVKAFA